MSFDRFDLSFLFQVGYKILVFPGRWVPAGTSKEPKIDLENLAPGKEYKFRVKAVNSEGASEPLEAENPILAKSKYGN